MLVKLNFSAVWALLLAFFVLSGCAKDQGPLVQSTGGNPPPPPDSTRYSTVILPLFNTYCTACHNQFHAKLKLVSCCSYEQLTSTGFSAPYVFAANPAASKLLQYLHGNPIMMPPSGQLPQSEIDKVQRWIQEGAKKN